MNEPTPSHSSHHSNSMRNNDWIQTGVGCLNGKTGWLVFSKDGRGLFQCKDGVESFN